MAYRFVKRTEASSLLALLNCVRYGARDQFLVAIPITVNEESLQRCSDQPVKNKLRTALDRLPGIH